MIPPPLPIDEVSRLEALKAYQILDTEKEADFDELTELASEICDTPVSLVSLVDHDRQWFKAQTGYITVPETSRDISFCGYTILNDEIFEVSDATIDHRFFDNPLVLDNIVRFYAGIPITDEEGYKLGSLCVIDRKPRQLSDNQKKALKVLAKQVMVQIAFRQKVGELNRELRAKEGALAQAKRAQIAADKANKSKSQFLANMSHEIRTPLHGMTGIMELLQDTSLDSLQASYLQTLTQSTNTLRGIINDILDLAKIEAGKMNLVKESTSLTDLIHEVKQLYGSVVQQKGLRFQCDIYAHVPYRVMADSLKIKQILSNLLSNAVKFTAQGSITLQLHEVQRKADQQAILRFTVADTGIGISQEKQALIFEAFEQEDLTTSQYYGGTGLGLSIVKKLTTMMEGTICLKSPVDPQNPEAGGTAFCVEIPVEIVEDEPAVLSSTDSWDQQPKISNLGALKVLVAEDNPVNQMIIRKHLQKLDIDCTIVANGQLALDQLRQNTFDLILMDIAMPVMDGATATTAIRQTLQSDIPIIALTANIFPEDQVKYRSIGMDDFLGKPFTNQELKEALYRFVNRQQLKQTEA